VVSHTPRGQTPEVSLAPGPIVDAMVHRYPGSGNYRVLLSDRFGSTEASEHPGWAPPVTDLASATAAHRRLLSENPWARTSPVATEIRLTWREQGGGVRWRGEDPQGTQVPVVGADPDLWRLAGVLGGRFGTVIGEWGMEGLRPASLVTPGGLVAL
jgi:hypothetical protein